ncbi:hypothetical protein [Acidithiobacillus sp.]|uniref:hypothetical protein n=1 Tax=Acidithiobacillus sp. TaxID=1872118 RepID=UPI003D03D6BC
MDTEPQNNPAATLDAATNPPLSTAGDSEDISRYLRTLAVPTRDTSGKLLRAGTRVLFNPAAPDEVREDNAGNRAAFMQGNLAWSRQTLRKAWFGSGASPPAETVEAFAHFHEQKLQFTSNLDVNLSHATEGVLGHAFPSPHPPTWAWLLPWEPKVRRVDPMISLAELLWHALRQAAGVPRDLNWPADWERLAAGSNDMRVYQLSTFKRTIHVVVAFITPATVSAPGALRTAPATGEHIETVLGIYDQWLRDAGRVEPEFTYFSIASGGRWPKENSGFASANRLAILVSPGQSGGWTCRIPPRYGDRRSIRDFMDALMPETRKQRASRIMDFLQTMRHYEGTISVKKVKDDLPSTCTRLVGDKPHPDYRDGQILRAFADIQSQGEYLAYKTRDGQYAIRRRDNPATGLLHGDASETTLAWRPHVARQVCIDLTVVVVPQLANLLLYSFGHGTGGSTCMAVVASVLGGYTAQVLQRYLNRPQSD